jgi:putative hydrolase of the HAD superfamily
MSNEHLGAMTIPGGMVEYFQNVETGGMTIRAVFFDMGGTIETFCYTRESRLKVTPGIQQRLLSAGVNLHLGNEQLFEVVSSGLNRYHQWSLQSLDELPPQRVWHEYILVDFPVDPRKLDAIAEDLMAYIETHYYHRAMRPEMPVVLDAIQKMGLKIGIISNICSRGQVPLNLGKYGLRHYFDPIVLSSEYGRRKPDPSIFHYAARLANVPTSECLYVGDRIARDILGARRAGYRLAIQIQHDFNHGEADEGATPDAVIANMNELVDILRAEQGVPGTRDNACKSRQDGVCAFLFDAGDILYFRPQRDRKLNAFLKELSLPAAETHAAEIEALRQRAFLGQITREQYCEAILRLYDVTRPEHIVRGKQIMDEDTNNVKFFDGVRETLLALKEREYLLGIITDTTLPVHVKLGWFDHGGFGHVWDSFVSSKELGIRKPAPQIYHAALKQLGLRGDQAVFVGHKASELDGARAVGMKTIAFNYEKNVEADFFIDQFADLLKIPIIP